MKRLKTKGFHTFLKKSLAKNFNSNHYVIAKKGQGFITLAEVRRQSKRVHACLKKRSSALRLSGLGWKPKVLIFY